MDELDAAFDAALDAPPADQSPWRVLADVLLSHGLQQGELVQLELDAELGPLRGLARGRLPELRETLHPKLLPPGVVPDGAVFRRGVLLSCVCTAPAQKHLDAPAWRTVERLQFAFEDPGAVNWNHTPLAGAALRRVETLGFVAAPGLEVLVHGPQKPRLSRLTIVEVDVRPEGWWATRWRTVLAAHPRLRDLRFGPSGLETEQVLREFLLRLREFDLDQVSVALGAEGLARLFGWVSRATPRFEVVARLSSGRGSQVTVTPAGLALRSAPDDLARLEQIVRANWPGDVPLPPLTGSA